MGKVEEGYRELLLNTMRAWGECSKLTNDVDVANEFIEKVNILATYLYPKIADGDQLVEYNSIREDTEVKTAYHRMMYLMGVASKTDLITPYEVTDEGYTTELDMEQAE